MTPAEGDPDMLTRRILEPRALVQTSDLRGVLPSPLRQRDLLPDDARLVLRVIGERPPCIDHRRRTGVGVLPPGNAWPGTRPIELARFRLLPMAKVGYPVFT